MAPIPVPVGLASDRVALRRLAERDVPAFVAAFEADGELARLIGIDDDPTPGSVRARISASEERRRAGEILDLALVDPGTDALLGSLWLHSYSARHRRVEVGFWVAPAARRGGVIRSAVTLVLDWLFGEVGLERVEITTTTDNAAVQRLVEQLGFTREGLLRERNLERGRRVDLVLFGLLRGEWRSPGPDPVRV
jgi:ribosomal-protein-alanine N-acetyltransferase